MNDQYQLFDELTPDEYAALKESIAERGVLVPIEIDEVGNILDGHHRIKAWQELRAEGVKVGDYPRIVRAGMTEEQKRNHVRALNLLRRHLSKEQRKEQMRQMRADGAGYEDIAQAAGVDTATAWRAAHNVNLQMQIENDRGQSRPATYQKRERPVSIFANTPRDESRSIDAAQHLDDAPTDKVLTTNRASRIAREVQAQERANTVTGDVETGSARLILGDFRKRGHEIADHSVDLIFTDPPYPEEFLPLWRDLSAFAARVLKPDGMLVAYTGAMYLPQILNMLGEHLTYWWTGSLVLHGSHSRVYARQIAQGSKPLLFYVPPNGKPRAWIDDTYTSEGETKDVHDWQQSIGAAVSYIEKLTNAGDLVIDPFLGGGTTGLAALRSGRAFVGFEIDPVAFAAAQEKINDG